MERYPLFIEGGGEAAIQVVVLRGTGRAAEIALAGGCERLARAI